MCGILFSLDSNGEKHFFNLSHRGPNSSTLKKFNYRTYQVTLGFHRLSITGVQNGEQPFFGNGVYLVCNGEIYNHKELKKTFCLETSTDSDCEVILALYLKHDRSMFTFLRGEYAFVLFDTRKGVVIYGRDTCGVRPLFISDDGFSLASELKGLPSKRGTQIVPGFIYTYDMLEKTTSSVRNKFIYTNKQSIKYHLIDAVKIRLESEVPIGFLLSGGFDSSIILSIASRLLPLDKRIEVFTVGFSEDAPDVVWARKVIAYLEEVHGKRYNHHVVIHTIDDGLAAIPEVITCTETYDTTTIRASTPMWLAAKYIKENTNVKVVISGEGSDEANGSYKYFLLAPNLSEFNSERNRLINDIYLFDGLRADRTISAHGLELRVPFLDDTVVQTLLQEDAVYTDMKKTGIEKQYIRECFVGWLSDEILWRSKEAFSDAVSFSWKDCIKAKAASLPLPASKYDYLNPSTSEERWYRSIFEHLYPGNKPIPYLWMPRWVDTKGEPSATVLSVYKK